jgi:hypothetical protein
MIDKRNDYDYVLNEVKFNGYNLLRVSHILKDNYDIAMASVKGDGLSLRYCNGISER